MPSGAKTKFKYVLYLQKYLIKCIKSFGDGGANI